MPNVSVTRRDTKPTTFAPFAPGGVDQFTSPSLLPEAFLTVSENLRSSDLGLSRRGGAAKLSRLSTAGYSKTFGADTKYATITSAAQLRLPKGGWGIRASFVMSYPASGKTGYVISSHPAGVAWQVTSITVSDAGVITVAWRDTGGNTRTVSTAAVTNGVTVHLLAIYDPYAGTFTVYVNGASSGTPLTSLDSDLQPIQTATNWVIGVDKQTGGAVTADSFYPGAIDSLTLFSFAGVRPSSGTTTLVATLLAHSKRRWPNPQSGMVRFNYDCDDLVSGGTLTDSSRFKNHATITGAATDTTPVGLLSIPGQMVGAFEGADGSLMNIFGAGGAMYYEVVRKGV